MQAAAGKIYVAGDVEIDTGRVVIRRAGEERSLRPKTFRLLIYLVEHRDRLVPKEELIEQLWPGIAVSDGALAQCISDIRRALDEHPRNPQFIRTAARFGYQFIAPLNERRPESVILEEITEERVEYSEEMTDQDEPVALDLHPVRLLAAPHGRYWRHFALLIVAGLAIASAVAVWRVWPRPSPGIMEPGIRTVIVEFENRSGRPDVDWLRTGLADMMATRLSASPRIVPITAGQLRRELRQSSAGSNRREEWLQAAHKAGATAMITGAFAAIGKVIRVDVQLYDVPAGRALGGESLTVNKPELLLAEFDSLATKLATRLGAPLTSQTYLAEVMTDNLEAYRLYSLGVEHTRNVRFAEAIGLYEKAVALDPGFAMAYARIGFTYALSWGRLAEGKPYLERAYRLSSRLTPRDRLFIRAWYSMACEDYPSAERGYREILSAFPLDVEGYHALGGLLLMERRFVEARLILERGLAIDPDMPQLHNMLTGAYLELGYTEQALKSAKRYLSLSGEPNAYDTVAEVYERTGQYDKARQTYLQAIRRQPDFEFAIKHLGNLYFQLGRYRDALKQYQEYIRLAPSTGERVQGHVASAWVYWKKGEFANAAREAAEAQRLSGKQSRESLLIEADRGELALTEDLRRSVLAPHAARGGPENRRIPYFILGYLALREHKTEESLNLLRAAVAEPPVYWNVDPLETCLADALLELGRLDEAIAEYKRILAMNPNYPMARYRLGLALERKGVSREARAQFERFLTIWKDADADVPELVEARRRAQGVDRSRWGVLLSAQSE